jgi:hypothetical protein
VLRVSVDVLTVEEGAVAATAGVTAVSAGVVTVAAGAVAGTAGVTADSADGAAGAAGAMAVSAGVETVAAGVTAFSEGVLAVAMGAAAAAAQCSEIMFNSVTARLLSVAAELALCPMRVTSWPRCGLRSTLLLVTLKMWPVLSCAIV